MLNNRAFKHLDNDEDAPLIRDYLSQEIENKFRVERKLFGDAGWEATMGAGYEYVKYNNSTTEQRYNPGRRVVGFGGICFGFEGA